MTFIDFWILELEFLPDVLNDLDIDFSANPAAAQAYINDQRNQRKIRECTQALEVNVIHPLREGKRLLVLDLDYSEHIPSFVSRFVAERYYQPFWIRNHSPLALCLRMNVQDLDYMNCWKQYTLITTSVCGMSQALVPVQPVRMLPIGRKQVGYGSKLNSSSWG